MFNLINKCLRFFFFIIFVRFIVMIVLGVNIRNRERLPKRGPAVLVANHNSHLDTAVLISLLPARLLPKVKPVAAADYFLRNRLIAWFSQKIVGIIPISRSGLKENQDPLTPCYEALEKDDILILFPEGTRGEPEHLSKFKKGVAFIAKKHPHVPVIPIFIHGLGKSLPKGEALLVPFFCDMFIGEPVFWQEDTDQFMILLNQRFEKLTSQGHFEAWE